MAHDRLINSFELSWFYAWHWKSFHSCFGGWWKHSSGRPSYKPNPAVAWAETAGAYHRLCVLACCLRKLSLHLLRNTPLWYLWAECFLMPNTFWDFTLLIVSQLWLDLIVAVERYGWEMCGMSNISIPTAFSTGNNLSATQTVFSLQ